MADEPEQDSAPDVDAAGEPKAVDSAAPAGASLAAALVAPPEATREEAYEKRARLAEARVSEVLAAFRQFKTETEGHKERAARTLERRFEKRHENLLLKFIDILDNFDRALDAAEQTYAGAPLIEGLILVRTQLLQTLQQEGLERIPVLGLPFDPAVAEAMGTAPVEDPEQANLVVKEFQRGYRLFGRLARPSRVVVGSYEAKSEQDVAEEGPGPAAAVIPVDDHNEPLRPTAVDDEEERESREPAVTVTPIEDEGPSLEEIVARAEAQRALFAEAFAGEGGEAEHEARPGEAGEEKE